MDRFVSQNKKRVERGERFSQITDGERDDIIDRARRIAATGANLSEVARTVATEVNRSTETIRYTIKNFDRQFPKMAVFPDQREVLSDEDRRAMYQQHNRGVSTVVLAKRYGRIRSSIVRILNEQRAIKISELPLDYIPNIEFDDESRVDEMTADLPAAASGHFAP